jgi:hypothetical protein
MLLAWPLATAGGYQITCRMLGRVTTSCCCARAHAGKPASEVAELRSRSCCEVSAGTHHDAVPGIRFSELRLELSTLALVVPAFTELRPLEGRVLETGTFLARAPPASAPPIYLENCSLLI